MLHFTHQAAFTACLCYCITPLRAKYKHSTRAKIPEDLVGYDTLKVSLSALVFGHTVASTLRVHALFICCMTHGLKRAVLHAQLCGSGGGVYSNKRHAVCGSKLLLEY